MTRLTCLILTVLVAVVAAALVPAALRGGQNASDVVAAGRILRLESKILGEAREVWLRLPPGYDQATDRYPVLIQLGAAAHFLYSAAVVDLLSGNDHIPKMIVAAVADPTPRHHYRDSTPTKVDYLPASGGASLFLRFLKEELVPALESGYRTRPFRLLCGHGLSGLFALYALLEAPETFRACLTDGASLAYDDSALLKRLEASGSGAGLRGLLYLGVGNEQETLPPLRRLAAWLSRSGAPGLEWTLRIEADEDQGTAALPVFHQGLKWIFRDWRIPVETIRQGWEAVRAHVEALSKRYGYDVPLTAATLSGRGFGLLREQRFEEAGLTLELNARTFPDLPDVHHHLAVLAERMKKWEQAAAHYDAAAAKASAQPPLAQFYRSQAEGARRRIKSTG